MRSDDLFNSRARGDVARQYTDGPVAFFVSTNQETSMLNLTNDIIAYEQGELDDEDAIALFQELVNSGLAWELQGHYGRTAAALIDAGLVSVTVH